MKNKQSKTVKAWGLVNTYNGKLLAYGHREGNWTYAIFPNIKMAKGVNNSKENVDFKIIPITISYEL